MVQSVVYSQCFTPSLFLYHTEHFMTSLCDSLLLRNAQPISGSLNNYVYRHEYEFLVMSWL